MKNKKEELLSQKVLKNISSLFLLLKEQNEPDLNLDRFKLLGKEIKDREEFEKEVDEFFSILTRLIQDRKIYKEELKVAEKIQEALIPDEAPEIEGFDIFPYFKAARVVSGDYYDFIPIASNLIGFTVADVSGKGLPGSLIMSMARSVLRFESQQNPFPGLVLRHVSSVLLKDLKPGFFITMVYAILNTTSKVLSVSSAGHNPVLLFRKSEGEIQELKPRGVGIGIGDELFFEKHLFEEKFFLQQGDIYFMYTDGLTEAMNESEEEFGLERVKEIILENSDKSSKKIVEEIIKEVESFRKDAPQNDDITILCLKTK